MSEFAVVLVFSNSHAVRAERVLKRSGLAARLIPTPRHMSSDCGSAVRILREEREACERALAGAGVRIDRIEPLDE